MKHRRRGFGATFLMLVFALVVPSIRAAVPAEISTAIGDLERKGIAVETGRVFHAVVEALARTGDPGARVVSAGEAEQMRRARSGTVFHAGLQLTVSNGVPVIAAVAANAPAARAGLKPGQVVSAVDGAPVQRMPIHEVIGRLRAAGNATVRLTVDRTNEIPLRLEPLPLPAVDQVEQFEKHIGYIRVNGLYAGAGTNLATLLRTMSEHAGVVLDLRSANGDDMESAAQVAEIFSEPDDLLYTLRDARDRDVSSRKAGSPGPHQARAPLIALVDGRTTGAAEVLAAIAAGSGRGVMVLGAPTGGDPLIRDFVPLSSGDVLCVATRRLAAAGGAVYTGTSGVAPDVLVEAGERPYETAEESTEATVRRATLDEELADRRLRNRLGGDEPLRRAVDILVGLKALNIRGFGSSQNAAR